MHFRDYTKTIELNPEYVRAYVNRGLAYFSNNEFDRALKDYTKALELDPDYLPTYYNRAKAWLYEQEWEKARTDLIVARDGGIEIDTLFRKDYQNVAGFKRKTGVELPEDIAIMLTRREEKFQAKPIEERPFQPPSEIDPRPFKNISAILPERERHRSISSMLINLPQHQSGIGQYLFAG